MDPRRQVEGARVEKEKDSDVTDVRGWKCLWVNVPPPHHPIHRHAKRLNFDTSGILEDPKLTRKQRDLRQKNVWRQA